MTPPRVSTYTTARRCEMDKILYIFLWPSELAATLAVWAFVAVVVVVEVMR